MILRPSPPLVARGMTKGLRPWRGADGDTSRGIVLPDYCDLELPTFVVRGAISTGLIEPKPDISTIGRTVSAGKRVSRPAMFLSMEMVLFIPVSHILW